MVENRQNGIKKTYRNPGDAIEGDKILVWCRKPGKWDGAIRASESHHYYQTVARMNARAVITKTFTNLQK